MRILSQGIWIFICFTRLYLGSTNVSSQESALIALYDATGGSRWTNHDNWLDESAPLSEWYGITCDDFGNVIIIDLNNNNLRGNHLVLLRNSH